MDTQAKCVAPKSSIANNVLSQASEIALRMEKLVEMASQKLAPIVSNAYPVPECDVTEEEEYPQLFNDYRFQLNRINNSIEQIEDFLRRSEI